MNKSLKYILYTITIVFFLWKLIYSGILRAIVIVWDMVANFFNQYITIPLCFLLILSTELFIIIGKRQRKKEIKNKVVFMAMSNIKAGIEKERVLDDKHCFAISDRYFEDIDGIVAIPKYAKCIILEYLKENDCYVKVKFEDYPEPLFTASWLLRTPKQIELLEKQLEEKS